MAGYMPRRFTRPQADTRPSTNLAQCRLTTLIEANALTTTLRRHPKIQGHKPANNSHSISTGNGLIYTLCFKKKFTPITSTIIIWN